MGKASSAKKIAKAAKAGATSGPSDSRQLGFPALVIAIIVVGLGLVVFARGTRDAQASPTLQDHWHSAYAVYDCESDAVLPPFQSDFDPDGIHSHRDSLIHIHPFTSAVTGKDAVMEVFLTSMGASISQDAIELPGGELLEAGVECGGEASVIQILRWNDSRELGDPDEVITEDLDGVRFLGEGEAFTIARAPLGWDIPTPTDEALSNLAAVRGQPREEGLTRDEDIAPRNVTDVPGPQDFGTSTDGDGASDGEPTDEGDDESSEDGG